MGQFRFLTAGESHGPGLTALVEGIPAGISLSEDYIRQDLAPAAARLWPRRAPADRDR